MSTETSQALLDLSITTTANILLPEECTLIAELILGNGHNSLAEQAVDFVAAIYGKACQMPGRSESNTSPALKRTFVLLWSMPNRLSRNMNLQRKVLDFQNFRIQHWG